ncbi:hypothetical protein BHS07_15655 [Myxococcus xanthus]|nr:hypothetical protein BHS07_15655 [Myxococcus xanthus]
MSLDERCRYALLVDIPQQHEVFRSGHSRFVNRASLGCHLGALNIDLNVHFSRVRHQRKGSSRGRPAIREEDPDFVALAFREVRHRLHDDRPLTSIQDANPRLVEGQGLSVDGSREQEKRRRVMRNADDRKSI